MPYNPFNIADLIDEQPTEMLEYHKNCVAMSFSRVLGINVYATINFFIAQKWIDSASKLENASVVEKVLKGLKMKKLYTNEPWSSVKIKMTALTNARYFAVNTGVRDFTSKSSVGHAFCIIKNNGLGVVGNNSEKARTPYHSQINSGHKISVWGPVEWTPYYGKE